MNIDFNNLNRHIIPMVDFSLNWRFMDDKHDKLPDLDLNQLKPLDKEASKFLWDFIAKANLHSDIPFKKNFFKTIDKTIILDGNETEIQKWLYHRGLPFDKEVFLSWTPTEALIVPWEILVKYFDSFYYSSSDDLTVFDQSLIWTLLFLHYDEIYFGTNTDFKPSETFADLDE